MVPAILALLVLSGCTGPQADTGGGEAGSTDVRIPWSGGEVAARVSFPAAGRLPGGAPVVVTLPGGWDAGAVSPAGPHPDGSAWGYVVVEPLLPGGAEGALASDGEADHRGPDSAEAARQAIRFATGSLADASGRTLDQVIPAPLAGVVGVVGRSNGGNLALAALAGLDPGEPPPDWLVTWESPVGDQYAAVELNRNPYYEPGTCGISSCPWPGLGEVLAFDPDRPTLAMMSEDAPPGGFPGRLFLDQDGDRVLDPDTERDFDRMVLGEVGGEDRLFPSTELSAEIDARSEALFGTRGPPEWLADPGEAAGFWSHRDGILHVAAAHAGLPDLLVMHLGSREDHFQEPADHPHARSHVAAWLDQGHGFVRVNPDAAYLALVTGEPVDAFPDNPAGELLPWPGTDEWMEPERAGEVVVDDRLVPAAVLELSDRAWQGDRSPDLDAVLEP